MARSSLKIVVDQKTPLNLENKSGRPLLRKVIRHLEGILGGSVNASHVRISVDGAQPVAASSTLAVASAVATNTVLVNLTTLTATEKRANCTVTVGTSVDDGDTVTVNGTAVTARTSPTLATEFLITGTAATDAAALVTCINAQAALSGIIQAVRRAANGVVSIYALATGTAGNSYTIATSDAVDLAITDDNAGAFAGGAASVNDVFDPFGSNTVVAKELAACIMRSTTAKIAKHVEASNWAGSIALSTCPAGTVIRVGPHELKAIAVANTTPQAGPADFYISGSDTTDGDRLVIAINTHPLLSHDVVASNSSGTVTIRQRRGTSAYGRIQCEPKGSQTVTQFAEVATVLVSALDPDQTGNAIPLSTTGGTITAGATALAGGTGAASGTSVVIRAGSINSGTT